MCQQTFFYLAGTNTITTRQNDIVAARGEPQIPVIIKRRDVTGTEPLRTAGCGIGEFNEFFIGCRLVVPVVELHDRIRPPNYDFACLARLCKRPVAAEDGHPMARIRFTDRAGLW